MDEVYKLQDFLIRTNTSWREHAKLYGELAKVVDILPFPFLQQMYELMVPKLFALMRNSAESIKGEAALLLAHLIYYIPNTEKKHQAFDQL
jgi:hypothetical protein